MIPSRHGVIVAVRSCLLLSTVALVAFSQGPPCTALVTDLAGSFQVRRAGKGDFEKGVWGMQLYSGDEVKTLNNTHVSLLFQNGNLVTLGPGSSLTVTDNSRAHSFKSIKSLNDDVAASLTLPRSGGSHGAEAGALAGLRADNSESPLVAVSPRNTKIKSDTPSFAWTTKQKYDTFTVTLLGDKGVIWKQKTSGMKMEYPAGVDPLERGKSYYWFVEGAGLFESAKSASVAFTPLLADDLKAVDGQERRLRDEVGADDGSLHFLLGRHYDRQGLLSDAVLEFERIASTNPDAPLPHEILGSLYERIGLKDVAIAELQKAVALSQKRE